MATVTNSRNKGYDCKTSDKGVTIMLINGVLITLAILLAVFELITSNESAFARRLRRILIILIVPLLGFFLIIVGVSTIRILTL